MIFTALSPQTQLDDFFIALKAIFFPHRYNRGNDPLKIQKWFSSHFETPYVTTYDSARTALFKILEAWNIGKDDEVIVQGFTCVAVINPIKWVGAMPVFVDIDPRTYNVDIDKLKSLVNEKTKAIIVQHTFGYPGEIQKIVAFARKKKIFVIEDCAHTIKGKLGGKLLGTFGDAAIFSFGREKAISGAFGGVALTKDTTLGAFLQKDWKTLRYPSSVWVMRQLLYPVAMFLTKKLYRLFGLGKIIHLVFLRSRLLTRSNSREEKLYGIKPHHIGRRLSNGLATVSLYQLLKLDTLNRHRNELALFYTKMVGNKTPQIKLPDWKIENLLYPLRFPLQVESRDKVLSFARLNGVELGDWYDVPVAPNSVDQQVAGYKEGSCPQAEIVCKQVINLPTHIGVGEKEKTKIVDTLERFYVG